MNKKMTDVLNVLNNEDNPSQREIAKKTGISLGLVNTLIKKCAKKGLVKIERINSRNIRYILTPDGIKTLTKKTIDFVKRSYQAIQQIRSKVKELAEKHKEEDKEIYVLNEENNEVFELVINTLEEINIDYKIINSLEELSRIEEKEIVVFHWNPEICEKELNFELVDIFNN